MAQSLENKFERGGGSRLGYPNNPAQPIATGNGPSAEAMNSTLHDLYSYDGNPIAADVAPRYENYGKVVALPSPTSLQAFKGPQNIGANAAGFQTYNNQRTYDSFILNQGAKDGAEAAGRFQGAGNQFIGIQ